MNGKDAIGCPYFVLSIKILTLVSTFGFRFVKEKIAHVADNMSKTMT